MLSPSQIRRIIAIHKLFLQRSALKVSATTADGGEWMILVKHQPTQAEFFIGFTDTPDETVKAVERALLTKCWRYRIGKYWGAMMPNGDRLFLTRDSAVKMWWVHNTTQGLYFWVKSLKDLKK